MFKSAVLLDAGMSAQEVAEHLGSYSADAAVVIRRAVGVRLLWYLFEHSQVNAWISRAPAAAKLSGLLRFEDFEPSPTLPVESVRHAKVLMPTILLDGTTFAGVKWDDPLAYSTSEPASAAAPVPTPATGLPRQHSAQGPAVAQPSRPYPQLGPFTSIENHGNSTYHSLQPIGNKRLSHGLTFLSAFTFAKSINDQPEICCAQPWPQNSYDLRAEKGRSDFDQRLRWVNSFDYQPPFGKGQPMLNSSRAADLAVGGWHLGGILSFGSDFPFSPVLGYDPSNTGSQGLAFGNAGRNVLEGPGSIFSDMSLRKQFAVTEHQRLEFRAGFFNVLNHPNFAQPDNFIDYGPGSAAVITSTAARMRQIQFAFEVQFLICPCEVTNGVQPRSA